jgi:DNA-directed RNA polymerase specialized sigma24 family protein
VTSEATSAAATLVVALQPRLRQAMAAKYGPEIGLEAADEAVAWAIAHPDRVVGLDHPLAYLYRVAQSKARPSLRWVSRRAASLEVDRIVAEHIAPIDPGLVRALGKLPPDHRSAVMLVHAHGWTIAEVAAARGVPVSTVTNHLRRGLAKLRVILQENR